MIANNPGIVERLRIARARVAAERRAILEAAPRPADWSRKPIAWRIIGTELLLEGSLTNKELARRLDSSDILKCPYGSTWLDSVNRRAFLVFVHRVRKWLKKPGIEGGRTRTSSIHKSRQ